MLLLDGSFCTLSDADLSTRESRDGTQLVVFFTAKYVQHFPGAVLDNDSLSSFGGSRFAGLELYSFELVGMRASWKARVGVRVGRFRV